MAAKFLPGFKGLGFGQGARVMAFVLFVAGEDSGDIVGEQAVKSAVSLGFGARGVGGSRMVRAGLDCLFDFEKFPVSGFGDVFPKLSFFANVTALLKRELAREDCAGVCLVDYPGMNLALAECAKQRGKSVLYLEPPQIFAWKASRAKKLAGVKLGVFFGVEKSAYEKQGLEATLLKHPFAETLPDLSEKREVQGEKPLVLFLPGSRFGALRRNLPLYVQAASELKDVRIAFLASRDSLLRELQTLLPKNFSSELVPRLACDRAKLFSTAAVVVAQPGTALTEAALSGAKIVSAVKPDFLTYALAKSFLKVPHLAMPNLILGRRAFPELVAAPFTSKKTAAKNLRLAIEHSLSQSGAEFTQKIREAMLCGSSVSELSLEFFGQLV